MPVGDFPTAVADEACILRGDVAQDLLQVLGAGDIVEPYVPGFVDEGGLGLPEEVCGSCGEGVGVIPIAFASPGSLVRLGSSGAFTCAS